MQSVNHLMSAGSANRQIEWGEDAACDATACRINIYILIYIQIPHLFLRELAVGHRSKAWQAKTSGQRRRCRYSHRLLHLIQGFSLGDHDLNLIELLLELIQFLMDLRLCLHVAMSGYEDIRGKLKHLPHSGKPSARQAMFLIMYGGGRTSTPRQDVASENHLLVREVDNGVAARVRRTEMEKFKTDTLYR